MRSTWSMGRGRGRGRRQQGTTWSHLRRQRDGPCEQPHEPRTSRGPAQRQQHRGRQRQQLWLPDGPNPPHTHTQRFTVFSVKVCVYRDTRHNKSPILSPLLPPPRKSIRTIGSSSNSSTVSHKADKYENAHEKGSGVGKSNTDSSLEKRGLRSFTPLGKKKRGKERHQGL